MIYLFTGVPGSSKTLNVLKMVNEDPTFKGREIYYHRIKELKLPWIELSADEVMEWDTLPHGAVLVVDEAQYLMPTRDSRKPMPDWIVKMSEHRHKGYDLIFITQNPMLLDAGFRRFVGKHIHIERVFGMQSAKWMTWEKCVSDIEDHFKRKEAVVKRVPFDKKYYDLYKSAEVHTHKRKLPLKVFIPFIFLAVVIGLVIHFLNRWDDRNSADLVDGSVPSHQSGSASLLPSLGAGTLTNSSKAMTAQEYTQALTPRLPDVPWSAPIYDAVTAPKSFPRPQCIRNNVTGVCKCFSQQATPITISQTACYNYVENGYFDHTKPDDYYQSSRPAANAGEQGLPRPLAAAR